MYVFVNSFIISISKTKRIKINVLIKGRQVLQDLTVILKRLSNLSAEDNIYQFTLLIVIKHKYIDNV